jgi:hypothetical protein
MAASHITTSGLVEDWPVGFSASLPTTHWLVVHAYPRQEKKLILDLRARRLSGCAFFERRIRHYPGKGTQELCLRRRPAELAPGHLRDPSRGARHRGAAPG